MRDAGVDTMQIALRAATHLDWVPSDLSGNRYAEPVTVYYTLAWFDRYVRGQTDAALAEDAFGRLTAVTFDAYADRHNISQGFYDPAAAATAGDPYAGNVPYTIGGLPVADRLSFYFLSKCFLTVPGTDDRAMSDDIRTQGCTVAQPAPNPQPPTADPGSDGDGDGGALPATGGGAAGVWILVLAVMLARSGRLAAGPQATRPRS